jgi:hypothetical protein
MRRSGAGRGCAALGRNVVSFSGPRAQQRPARREGLLRGTTRLPDLLYPLGSSASRPRR